VSSDPLAVIGEEDELRDLSRLVLALRGSLEHTGDLFEPYRLVDAAGVVVAPVGAYLRELAACGRPAATQRSYGMDPLRWFRLLWAVEIGWDQATRAESRDFRSWIQLADKPTRPHWRYPNGGAPGTTTTWRQPIVPNSLTGKPSPSHKHATATVVHCESVLRGFYDFHLEAGSGPMVNPFPLARDGGRTNAHHNPMDPFVGGRSGQYRPKLAQRLPRQIPNDLIDALFARLVATGIVRWSRSGCPQGRGRRSWRRGHGRHTQTQLLRRGPLPPRRRPPRRHARTRRRQPQPPPSHLAHPDHRQPLP
jgi:hypothetical protein